MGSSNQPGDEQADNERAVHDETGLPDDGNLEDVTEAHAPAGSAHRASEGVEQTVAYDPQAATPPDASFDTTQAALNGTSTFTSKTSAATSLDDVEFGEYELVEEIARGGMGVVYKARQKRLNRTVALKMILSGEFAGSDEVQRFQAEAEAAATLEHPGIVPIYEVGEHGGKRFFSMGFIEGCTLNDLVKEQPLDGVRAASLMAMVADAIAFAHQRGVVHRDLKPANVLIDQNGNPRVTDFGLAKRTDVDSSLTGTGQILGTPNYMAPEQAAGNIDSIGPAADIYSLGATLYCLLTGRPPFQSASLVDTLTAVINQEPVSPRQLNAAIDKDLETICLKCLRKEPAARYESAAALRDELHRSLNGEPIRARPISTAARTVRWCRRNPLVATLWGLVGMLLIAGSGTSLFLASRWKTEATHANDEFTRANVASAQMKIERNTARNERDKAQTERDRADEARKTAQRQIAETLLQRGQQLCEEGEQGRGLLWINRSLARLPEDSEVLDNVIRRAISARQTQVLPLMRIIQHRDYYPMAFSSDGMRYAGLFNEDQTIVQTWDVASGMPVGPRLKHPGRVSRMTYSADARLLFVICRDAKQVLKWDALTGKRIGNPYSVEAPIGAIAIHPESLEISIATDQVRRFDVETGASVGNPISHDAEILALAYSHDGTKLAVGGADRGVQMWDLENGEVKYGSTMRHSELVSALAFSPDAIHLAVGHEKGLQVWNVDTGIPTWSGQHASIVHSLTFSHNGKLLSSASADENVRLWSMATGEAIGQPLEHGFAALSSGFSPDDRLLLTGSFFQSKIWSIEGEQPRETILRSESPIRSFDFSSDRKTLAVAAGNDLLIVRDIESHRVEHSKTHPAPVTSVSFAPHGARIATTCQDGNVRIWDVESGNLLGEPLLAGYAIRPLWNDTGELIFTAPSDSTMQLWNAETSAPVGPRIDHGSRMNSARLSPNRDQLLTIGSHREVRFWDTLTGERIADAPTWEHPIQPSVVDYSPDGKRVLVAGFHQILVKRAADGETLCVLDHRGYHTLATFSPDGKVILTGGTDATIRLWDSDTFEPLGLPIVHTGKLRFAHFSPDSTLLVTAADDRQLRLIDVRSARELGWSPALRGDLTLYAFDDDSDALITASSQGFLQSWRIPTPIAGTPEETQRQAEILTGLSIDATGAIDVDLIQSWQARRKLQGIEGPKATFEVSNVNDAGNGSLRKAINQANIHFGDDTIRFKIDGSGIHTIRPQSKLPMIQDTVTIDGTTQPGYDGHPRIEIDGSLCDRDASGLTLNASGCTIRGLIINRFPKHGIIIPDAGNDSTIEGNFIGTDASGTQAAGNGRLQASAGIVMWGGVKGNRVGSDGDGVNDARERNVVSANNGSGVGLAADLTENVIRGNYIGTDLTGAKPLPNRGMGIRLAPGGKGNIIENNTIISRHGREPLIADPDLNQVSNNTLSSTALPDTPEQ